MGASTADSDAAAGCRQLQAAGFRLAFGAVLNRTVFLGFWDVVERLNTTRLNTTRPVLFLGDVVEDQTQALHHPLAAHVASCAQRINASHIFVVIDL